MNNRGVNTMKKVSSLLLALYMAFYQPAIAFASTTETSTTTETTCYIVDEIEYGRLSDTTGKDVMMEMMKTRECHTIQESQGDCIRWEDVNVTFDLNATAEAEIEARDYTQSMGSVLSILSVSAQIDNVFSGWKGYCVVGTETDFSAFEDPMFWLSIAMSLVGGSGGVDVVAGNVVDGALSVLGEQAAVYAAYAAGCAAMSSADMADAVIDMTTTEGEPLCDPIDEFCDDDSQNEDDFFTLKRYEYEALVIDSPELASSIEIVDQPTGAASPDDILTIRLKPMTSDDINGLSEDDYKAMEEEMKRKQAQLKTAIVASQIAACTVSQGSVGTGSSDGAVSDDGTLSAANLGVMALSMINPMLGAAASIVMALVDSFKDIDSCGDQADAEAKGERHVKTYESIHINGLCRPLFDECLEDNPIGGGCWRTGYTYCCYDQAVSRYLMEQIKAQLGKDWAHCSDLNMREISVINFRSCSEDDKTHGIDGGTITKAAADGLITGGGYASYYDMAMGNYYQAKQQCLDYEHLTEYIVDEFDGKISTEQIMEHINNLNSVDSQYTQ